MIQDLVPKAIMHLLVNFSRDVVQQRLVTNLYKPDLFGELLYEDEALVTERTRIKTLLDAYKEAFKWVFRFFPQLHVNVSANRLSVIPCTFHQGLVRGFLEVHIRGATGTLLLLLDNPCITITYIISSKMY
jgi:hypothetical protein